MVRTLALKELRELAGIAVIAGLAYGVILMHFTYLPILPMNSYSVGYGREYGAQEGVTFLQGLFYSYYLWITALSAIACGFRQTLWEERQGTWQFLIHRPIERWKVHAVKLGVGLGVGMVLSAIPIVLYGSWGAYLRQAPAPFAWSMSLETWKAWWSMPCLYLGAFLSGFRPARWIGTRLFPLGGAAMMATFTNTCLWRSSLPIACAMSMGLIACIYGVSCTRDDA